MTNDVDISNQKLPAVSATDIPVLIEQAQAIHSGATGIGAKKIEFTNGLIYQKTGDGHVVAGNGGIVEVTQTTTTVTIANPGVALKDAVPEVAESHTQEIAAAFANTSQPSISVQLNPPKK